jgi:8-oxo-dGTP diphosphatase
MDRHPEQLQIQSLNSDRGEVVGASEQGANATDGRWLVIPRTLCFVLNAGDILLMKRAAHKRVFPNRYNGVGGHIERDEDPYTSARREILEETGLTVRDLRLRAVYNIDTGETNGILLFVFTAISDSRAFRDSEEGTLQWIAADALAGLDLVEDLPLLLPRLLAMGADDPAFFVHVSYNDRDELQMCFAEMG